MEPDCGVRSTSTFDPEAPNAVQLVNELLAMAVSVTSGAVGSSVPDVASAAPRICAGSGKSAIGPVPGEQA